MAAVTSERAPDDGRVGPERVELLTSNFYGQIKE
jgi:hypothetical protein